MVDQRFWLNVYVDFFTSLSFCNGFLKLVDNFLIVRKYPQRKPQAFKFFNAKLDSLIDIGNELIKCLGIERELSGKISSVDPRPLDTIPYRLYMSLNQANDPL
jgi:hypothetical protein